MDPEYPDMYRSEHRTFYRAWLALACLLACPNLWPPSTEAAEADRGRVLPVEESLRRFVLPKGYLVESTLSEPAIAEPVDIVFDGNGRMFVAEMRAYMQDVDGTDQRAPNGRVSLHEDRDGDGVYETHSIFADHLVLPRMMLPLQRGELLLNETDTQDIFLYRDTDGDGVADQKTPWYVGGSRGGNLEHQQSGLTWSVDNWMYMTINPWRLRWQGYDQPPVKEPTPPNGGQWGLSQDNLGKLWFLNAGGEIGPLNFQVPIVYGRFSIPGETSPDFRTVYPLPTLPDMQAGTRQMRPEDGTLNHFTSTCGGEIFRGDRLPEDLRGDLFFSEPVGRIVRQAKVEVRDGLTYLSNARPGSEFIRTTDPNFRAVQMKTAPDGTLYVVDMHRGIIQEGAWVGEGTYLRRVVDQYALDKNILHGRILRVRHQEIKRGPAPRMDDESSDQLVKHLAHPNGWWRDTAQRLLVLRQARETTPTLVAMAQDHPLPLARMHALWTLEGLESLKASDLLKALKDPALEVRIAALRAAEPRLKSPSSDSRLREAALALLADPEPQVAIQAMLSDMQTGIPGWKERMKQASAAHPSKGMKQLAELILNPVREGAFVQGLSGEEAERVRQGELIYGEVCFACHGPDGRGMKPEGSPKGFTLAPPFAGSRTLLGHADSPIAVLLKGLTGPVNGKTYEAQMVPMENNDDAWVAAVLSYIRTHFGNRASTITPEQVARVREKFTQRNAPFTQKELLASFPQRLTDRSQWKVSASHFTKNVELTRDRSLGSRWDTQEPQRPGMWYAIEFPKSLRIAGIHQDTGVRFESGFPRGFQVEVSNDGNQWQTVATAKGSCSVTEVSFEPVSAKFLRMTLTESDNQFWIIGDLQVYLAGEQPVQASLKTTQSSLE